MARSGSKRNPTFFWQGLLILLPVGLLAALGFFFARQDKLIAEHEAVARAQNIAEELLPKLQAELIDTNAWPGSATIAFRVDASGRLLSPPPQSWGPVPFELDLSGLNAEQQKLWLAARDAENASEDPSPATRAYRELLAVHPPAGFAALAQYSLGLLLARQGEREAARSCFDAVREKYPEAIGESGLPLQPLAALKTLELLPKTGSRTNPAEAGLVDTLCSNVVWNPTQLSAEILDRVSEQATTAESRLAAAKWKRAWAEHDRARQLFAAASQNRPAALHPGTQGTGLPRAFWFATDDALPVLEPEDKSSVAAKGKAEGQRPAEVVDEPSSSVRRARGPEKRVNASWPMAAPQPEADQNWLAVRAENSTATSWYICRSQSEIGARLTTIVLNSKPVPEYFGVGLDVAGRRLVWPAPDLRQWEYQNYFGREGGGQKKVYLPDLSTNLLASAGPAGSAGLLKVSVYLTSRGALLAREQARSFWLAALVASAALAAGLGFIKAYRAFHRQLRLSELKSNFVSSVSHELRAPIASVRLMAESLERGKVADPGKQREYFKFIVQECRRLSSLVENVLDFSRIEQGRKQYDFEPTDVAALAQQTVKLLEPYAAEREVLLQLRLPDPQTPEAGLQLNADGKALQQALVNLIDNAVKHSPKGQTVTVGLERSPSTLSASSSTERADPLNSEDLHSGLRLWVEDHGEGIPPAEHEKIFERFYRRGSELRRETQGVGIGLSIVKHIAEAHRGHVEVRSEVGEGSRFTIDLPGNGEAIEKSKIRNPESE